MLAKTLQGKSVKSLGELKLVGFRVLCPGEQYSTEIPKASQRLESRLREIKNVTNKDIHYGAFVVDAKSEDEDGYWVGVEVAAFEEVPADMQTLIIPSQTYAAAEYAGANKGIFLAYEELHNWATAQGYQRLTDNWHLEIFRSWKDPENLRVELLDTIKN